MKGKTLSFAQVGTSHDTQGFREVQLGHYQHTLSQDKTNLVSRIVHAILVQSVLSSDNSSMLSTGFDNLFSTFSYQSLYHTGAVIEPANIPNEKLLFGNNYLGNISSVIRQPVPGLSDTGHFQISLKSLVQARQIPILNKTCS